MNTIQAVCHYCDGRPIEPVCLFCGGSGSIPAAHLTRADRREIARKRLEAQNAPKKP